MTTKAIDKRRDPALFYHPMGGAMPGPDGVTNTFFDIVGRVSRNGDAKIEKVGELQLGTDGFLEAMFFLNGKLFKLKMTPRTGPSDDRAYVELVWG